MKTCLYVHGYPGADPKQDQPRGGARQSLMNVLRALPGTGWSPHVVVPGGPDLVADLDGLGVPNTTFPYVNVGVRHPGRTLRSTLGWRTLLRRIRPDVVHGNNFGLSRSFGLAAASLGIPFVAHVRFPGSEADVRWVLRGLPKPRMLIFNSQALRDQMAPWVGRYAPKTACRVVHNSVDLAQFRTDGAPAAGTFRVGMIANFAPYKRHEDFLRTAAMVLEARQDVEFWIVGDDLEGKHRRTDLEKLATDLGIAASVKFLGRRSDMPQILSDLHLLMHPAENEAFGRVIVEAMAAGRPAVAARSGGITEIVEDGTTGFLADVGACPDYAKHILRLIDDRDLWRTMSERSVAQAAARFSNEAHVARLIEIYEQAARIDTRRNL